MKSLRLVSWLYPSPAVDLTSPKRAKAQLVALQGENVAGRLKCVGVFSVLTKRAATGRIAPNFNVG
jgi:hypothetical protein